MISLHCPNYLPSIDCKPAEPAALVIQMTSEKTQVHLGLNNDDNNDIDDDNNDIDDDNNDSDDDNNDSNNNNNNNNNHLLYF